MTGLNVIQWDGQPISEPGLYAGIPMAKYHSASICVGPSISSSGLRTILNKSARHYWRECPYNPDRVERKDTEAMMLGRAAHHLLLGEADFEKHFIVRPDKWDSWRTDAAKGWRALQILDGKTVLEPKHPEIIRGMAESMAAEPMVQLGILGGLIEHSLIYRDEETGVWIKVRPDSVPTDAADFSDLKTAADVSDDAIEKAIGELGYSQQGALVGSACQAVLRMPMGEFNLVFVEKEPPHCIQTRTLRPGDLELGADANAIALRMFAKCMRTAIWPGPGGSQNDAAYVDMKPWDRTRILNRIALLEMELAA